MNSKNERGKVYLIPSLLGEGAADFYTDATRILLSSLDFFVVENERSARRFLRSIGYKKNFEAVTMVKVENDKNFSAPGELLQWLTNGNSIGVISEAGCPGVADPGSAVVRWAHAHRFKVAPLIGPSSILLALMASGMNGQQFAFHGYLPVESHERKVKLKKLEEESSRKKQTQIFIETPYRNSALLTDILYTCNASTLLCIACNISLADEMIFTQRISEWKKNLPDLKKKPAVFLLMAE